MTPKTTLIDLIRHGEPEGGPMFRGHTDHPLSTDGWQQMHRAIRPQDEWDLIVSSPLLRCQSFARQLADNQGIPLHLDNRLQEISFGEWEGKTSEQIQAGWSDALNRFWSAPLQNPPPGGEPLQDFHARVMASWTHWQQELAGQKALIVCHGGVIRMILAEVMDIPLSSSFSALTVPYACRSRLRLDASEHGSFSCLQSHGTL